MSEREWAVRVFDSAPDAGWSIEPMGDQRRAEARVKHWEQVNADRPLYGVKAEVVYRYTFMPEMPWEALP